MFLRIFFVLGAVLALTLAFFDPSLFPFLLLIWLGLSLLITSFAIFFLFICSLFCYRKKPFEKDHPFFRFLAYHTMDSILAFFRFRVAGKNLEQFPEEPCVFVCNHLSQFDPMVSFVLLKKRRVAFLSKKENMKIPIAGPIVQKIGFLPLDRENPLQSMRILHQGAKLVSKMGFTMGIYPEGTRSFDGKLLPFKEGAFVMAKKAKCPLVITVIRGTRSFLGRYPLFTSHAEFEVIEVLSAEEVASKKAQELSDYCQEKIASAL